MCPDVSRISLQMLNPRTRPDVVNHTVAPIYDLKRTLVGTPADPWEVRRLTPAAEPEPLQPELADTLPGHAGH